MKKLLIVVDYQNDFIDGALDLGKRNLSFLAGAQHAVEKLIPVEAFDRSILFEHHQRHRLDGLIGGKAPLASQAFPPPPDSFTIVGRA